MSLNNSLRAKLLVSLLDLSIVIGGFIVLVITYNDDDAIKHSNFVCLIILCIQIPISLTHFVYYLHKKHTNEPPIWIVCIIILNLFYPFINTYGNVTNKTIGTYVQTVDFIFGVSILLMCIVLVIIVFINLIHLINHFTKCLKENKINEKEPLLNDNNIVKNPTYSINSDNQYDNYEKGMNLIFII